MKIQRLTALTLWYIESNRFMDCKYYRNQHNLFCCSGILFNHESPLRSNKFVFKKIILESKKLKKGGNIYLGDINVKRESRMGSGLRRGFLKMMQIKKATDLVIGSGNIYSNRSFLNLTFDNRLNKNN